MPAVVQSVVARSELVDGRENAWAALRTEGGTRSGFVVVAHFKAADYGPNAFKHAAKFGRRLAEELAVPLFLKRDPTAAENAKEAAGNPRLPDWISASPKSGSDPWSARHVSPAWFET